MLSAMLRALGLKKARETGDDAPGIHVPPPDVAPAVPVDLAAERRARRVADAMDRDAAARYARRGPS